MPAARTYEPIATTTLGSATATVTFSSIPSTYTDLICVIAGACDAPRNVHTQINTDTGTNYSFTGLIGNGTTASSQQLTGEAVWRMTALYTAQANLIYHFMNYSNTTTYKTALARQSNPSNEVKVAVGLWRSTAAINRIDWQLSGGTYNTGTTFTLYGITAA